MDVLTRPALDDRLSRLLPDIRCRLAESDDAAHVRQLIQADVDTALAEAPPVVRSMMATLRLDDWRSCLRRRHPGAIVLVAEDGAGTIGAAMVDWSGQGPARILDAIVDPNRRRMGLGGRLLDGLSRLAAAEGRALRVTVLYDSKARPLLRRHGFVAVAEQGMDVVWERPAP